MKNCIFAFLLLFVCTACSTVSVNSDFNPAYDFTELKTYSWVDNGKAPSKDTRINNDLIIDRVRSAVESNLAARGFVKTDTQRTDFQVSWHGAIKKKLQVETIDHFYSPYGYGSLYRDPAWAGSSMRTSTAREYEVGTLIIDILDPAKHKLIWRGSGSKMIGGESNPEKITKKINEAVAAILKDFPPVKKY
jgi:Domain of unknown function (DUF4136)